MKWIDEDLLNFFRMGGDCELCLRRCSVREPHHIIAKGMGGARRLDVRINLIAVGAGLSCACHTDFHSSPRFSPDEKVLWCLNKVILRDHLFCHTAIQLHAILRRLAFLPGSTTQDELAEMDLLRWFPLSKGPECLYLDQ